MIIKNKMKLLKLDKEGYFEDYEFIEVEVDTETYKILNVPEGYVQYSWSEQNPTQRWFEPKYDFDKKMWIESLSEDDIKQHDKDVQIESMDKINIGVNQIADVDIQNHEVNKMLNTLTNMVFDLNIKIKKLEGEL